MLFRSIAAANMTNINGFSGICIAGWCQNAGEKTVYALHQEKIARLRHVIEDCGYAAVIDDIKV